MLVNHDPVVESHPLVHPAQLHVADHVVQRLETRLGSSAGLRSRTALDVTGQVGPVAGPVDQAVPRLAVGGDGREPHRACSSVTSCGSSTTVAPWRGRVRMHRSTSGYLEGDVQHAVAVAAGGGPAPGWPGRPRPEPNPDRAGAQHVRVVVAVAGLSAEYATSFHAEHGLVEQRGLGGVADRPHQPRRRLAERTSSQLAQLVARVRAQATFLGTGVGGRQRHPGRAVLPGRVRHGAGAYSGPETGNRDHHAYVLRSGAVRFVLKGGVDPASPVLDTTAPRRRRAGHRPRGTRRGPVHRTRPRQGAPWSSDRTTSPTSTARVRLAAIATNGRDAAQPGRPSRYTVPTCPVNRAPLRLTASRPTSQARLPGAGPRGRQRGAGPDDEWVGLLQPVMGSTQHARVRREDIATDYPR